MKKTLTLILVLAAAPAGAFASGTALEALLAGQKAGVRLELPRVPEAAKAAADRIYQSETFDSKDKADVLLQSYLLNLKGAGVEVLSSFVDLIEDGDSTLYRFVISYRGGELRNYVFDGFPSKEKADAARDQALAGFKKAGFPVIKYGIRSGGGAFSLYAVYLAPEGETRREMSYMSIIPEANAPLNISVNDTVKLLENNGMPVLYALTSDAGTRFMIRFIGKGQVKTVQSGSHGSYVQTLQAAQQKLLELSKIPGSLPMDIEVRMSNFSYTIDYLQP